MNVPKKSTLLASIQKELERHIEPEKQAKYPKFFQVFPGGYGEGDHFLGVRVPQIRKIAKTHLKIPLEDLDPVISNKYHEIRLCAFMILVEKYNKAKSKSETQAIAEYFLQNRQYCNNWDLVDNTVYKTLGPYLIDKDKSILYDFAREGTLWEQRIAMITTFYFIKERKFDDALRIAEILLHHEHDLIHKAVGWMLREIGNRHRPTEEKFLKKHYQNMPRRMLRYAIEKFEPELRQKYLKGKI
ncbi:MAG: DNA alkylation repair protein [Promethearchaeota archaeon]